jgi:putative transcriptional regulator
MIARPAIRSPRPRSAARRRFLGPSLAAVLAAVSLVPTAPRAQSVDDGALLVANKELKDPNFSRTVVLVLRHDDSASIGVVINRVTSLEPAKIFPELAPNLGAYTGSLFRGGPVEPTRTLFLVRGLAAAAVEGPEIVDKVFLSVEPESSPDVSRLADGPDDLRVYAGHAIWGGGQLAREIAQGAWKVVPGTADLVFTAEPTRLWEQLAAGDGVVVDTRVRP